MFYGTTIKPGANVKLASDKGELLHISGACLSNPVGDDRTVLMLNHEEKNHVLCVLKKDHAENVPLDVFVPTRSGAYLKVQGKSEVSVIGYFEPSDSHSEISSDEDGLALEDDESTQVSSEDEATVSKLNKPNKKVQELEDDDDEEIADEEEDDEEEDDEEKDEEDDDEDDEELMQALQKQIAQKKAASKMAESKKKNKAKLELPGKKRKATEIATKPEKQQKTTNTQNAAGQQFEKAITEYLKKHGRSLISQVASSCPKPASVSVKYREFLVSRPSVFIVDGQHAALKS